MCLRHEKQDLSRFEDRGLLMSSSTPGFICTWRGNGILFSYLSSTEMRMLTVGRKVCGVEVKPEMC